MLKAMLAIALVVGGSSAALAKGKIVNYLFLDFDGNAYCDGLQLTQTKGVAVGIHTGSDIKGENCEEGDYAGGFQSQISGVGTRWVITTTDTHHSPGTTYVFQLDVPGGLWQGYVENTGQGEPFQRFSGGELLVEGKLGVADSPMPRGHRPVASAFVNKSAKK
ncbi:MAG: hypothetical protein ACREHF_12120 [Rhizomicrobium sp.]